MNRTGPPAGRRRPPTVANVGETVEGETPIAVAEPETPAEAPAERVPLGRSRAARQRKQASSLGGKAIASYPVRNVGTIAAKELYTFFASPVAYIVIAFFLLVNGYLFAGFLINYRSTSMVSTFGDMAVIMLFLAPAITMRLLAEEQRTGTIELLLTSPLRESELVLGKWLAALGFYALMLLPTLIYPLFLLKLGQPDMGAVWGGYVGVILLGGAFLAIGLLASALTQNQIVAFAVGFGVLLLLWLLQLAGQAFAGTGGNLIQYLALAPHFDSFTSGNIQVKDLVYYSSVILVALFLTVRVIETRRYS